MGYLFGSLLFPLVLMLGGRAIWCALQQKQAAPVLDRAWLVFGTGAIALVIALGNAGRDAEERESGDEAAVRVLRAAVPTS